ncbi:MAG: GPW/gp25 family protein [Asticcacaulis sp.]
MTQTGMRASDGATISGAELIAQSIRDILTTPIGSRVMRRDYGSRLPDLIDAPANAHGQMQIIAATATAIGRWEKRLKLKRVTWSANAQGRGVITLTGHRTDIPAAQAGTEPFTLSISL